jgi:ATP phosphoribosyltransferase regulatory subunit
MNGPSKTKAGSAYARQALLPEGFRDQLAPHAEQEASLVRGLVDTFLSHGYDRVSPPVVEYEDSLLVGAGATRGHQMFRVMDPDTQRMMAVRSDITIQMARLASTRLADAPRPLRLAYTGSVLRTKGSQIRPARQFIQAGVELVGSDSVEAELEVIAVAVEALQAVGIKGLSLDLTIAPLAGMLCDSFDLDENTRDQILEALDAKDVGALAALGAEAKSLFEDLLAATGSATDAMDKLASIGLAGDAADLVARLSELVAMLIDRLPDVAITIDPCETHGFEYKSGIGFALFAKGGKSELGRGGRYLVEHPDAHSEEATGFSVYLDSLMAALPMAESADKLYLPFDTEAEAANKLRSEGWRTIQGLTEEAESRQEAARLGCTHIYSKGAIAAL